MCNYTEIRWYADVLHECTLAGINSRVYLLRSDWLTHDSAVPRIGVVTRS